MDLLMVGIVINNSQISDEARAGLHQLAVRVVFDQREIGDWALFLEKLDQVRPDVLLIELNQLADPLEDVIRQIKSTSGSPRVIVIHPLADSETLLKAIRANADEYLFPPLKEDLSRALLRIGTERVRNRVGTKPRGKVFGLFSAKGGCGTTAICCHLAVQLSRQAPLEVLLADFDIESGLIGFLMQSQCRYSVLDAVDNIHRLDLSFWKALVSNGIPGLEVIMAPAHPGVHRERRIDDFRHILRFVRCNYDWTLVDLGRGLTPMSMTMLEELDEAFLVTTLDIPALHQTKHIVNVLRDLGYGQQRLRLVLNRMPRRHEITVGELEAMLGLAAYGILPADEEALTEAYADKKLASRESAFGKGIAQLASKISGLQPTKSKNKFFSLLG
ncbi:MAG TPA: hypothetical protein VM120_15880 [Bryobacteraceae bacterium]|nr:hypothetical protein [Bryobacteraceae bacterium]